MADDELAYSEFKGILSTVNRRFDIIHTKWSESKFFEVKFRTHIRRNSDDFNTLCDEWVDLFSNATSTIWVKKISNTGPKIRFRKQYQCWPQTSRQVQKELLFDARRCKATLDIKVLTDNPLTRRKNKHIRSGLNVVVKINFTHLHVVDTKIPFAYFVHTCDPQPEPPKPIIQPNEKLLSQKVAEMVQKGLNAKPKVVINNDVLPITNDSNEEDTQIFAKADSDPILQQNQLQLFNMEPVTLSPFTEIKTFHNPGEFKFDVQQSLPQFTQVVVTTPQLELTEPILMCQPAIMFDPTQMIPVTTHPIQHFVQVHSHNLTNQHGHYF